MYIDNASIGPHTTFGELYTYLICPARLYLKLAGAESEIHRKYTPPDENPYQIGKRGQDLVKNSFQPRHEVSVQSVKESNVRYPKGSLDKKLQFLRDTIRKNIRIQVSRINTVRIKSEPLAVSEEGTKLKKEHGIEAIIETLDYTTVPHHLVGEIDFVGIKEDKSIVIIEVKNKKRVNKEDKFQLEYYIHGISKQYNYNKFYKHKFEIQSQLYPEDYKHSIRLSKMLDLAQQEINDSFGLTGGLIETLTETENNKLKSIFEENEKYSLINAFLTSISEYNELVKLQNTLQDKIGCLNKRMDDNVSFLDTLMTTDLREGLMVDIRKGEIEEITVNTDFDSLAMGVWNIKNNAYLGTHRAQKVLSACSMCSFKGSCKDHIRDEAREEVKSITSIVHKGFSKNILSNPKSQEISENSSVLYNRYHMDNSSSDLPKEYLSTLKLSELLPIVLKGSEWPYRESLLKKRGWIPLYRDAIVSKKIDKEFNFWKI